MLQSCYCAMRSPALQETQLKADLLSSQREADEYKRLCREERSRSSSNIDAADALQAQLQRRLEQVSLSAHPPCSPLF